MADMKKVYDDLIIINLYTFLFTYAYSKEINFLLKKTYQSILILLHQSFQVLQKFQKVFAR